MVKKLLHIEGLVFFLVALFLYQQFHGNWIVFILLLFVPDISMLGYLMNKHVGAICYNLMHNYSIAVIIIFLGIGIRSELLTQLGIILIAHVGMDRLMGYGLKYPTHFKDTHLQRV